MIMRECDMVNACNECIYSYRGERKRVESEEEGKKKERSRNPRQEEATVYS